jgi:hypothetical protein
VPIHVSCFSCRQAFNAPDSAAGKRAKCPKCGMPIDIPGALTPRSDSVDNEILDAEPVVAEESLADEIVAAESSRGTTAGERKPCPMCGEMIRTSAVKCRFCGHITDPTLARVERNRGPGPVPDETVEEAAKRLIAEKYDKTTSIQIFVLSLIGCFSPILAIYGIFFLIRRPYPFPYKGLAIAGTVIHCIWATLQIVGIVLSSLRP